MSNESTGYPWEQIDFPPPKADCFFPFHPERGKDKKQKIDPVNHVDPV